MPNETSIMEQVLAFHDKYDFNSFTSKDVQNALNKDRIDFYDYAALLSPAALPFLEKMAEKAQLCTRKQFGNTIALFTPIYIANYCENQCVYCGFNCKNKIHRAKLNMEEIEREYQAIAATGLKEILILTGESRSMSGIEYIGEAVELAKKYFSLIGLEVYPVEIDEYKYLHEKGADFVTVFQETYNKETYKKVHLAGQKSIFSYRINAQERAILGGMRGVGFGALLGLDDFRHDAFCTGVHATLIQRKYPHAEIAVSVPRLRPYINGEETNPRDVHEKELLQIMCAHRLLMPFASITISTRERADFRNNAVNICATKISAGVSVGIGGHSEEEKGDEQFEISDPRSVDEVVDALHQYGLQPSFNDYIRLI
ncbi:MAG: 2-iminoacetate synthase ThiH [Candidatus Pseudoruminococcus sp.]|uniref:2-iminoacetate synthase ThiH n=1 Tax=Candidatus Pseudoruminococcus sp. TaxID=3101048 RepID=UPI002A7A4D2C|nr:2-iminoacetate synthase ThiH [Ruminococcus sp.]MDY2781918.1 2-iminoacetate synthase ThiH [Candidatus Pseudoruminococcus sp.]